MRTTYRTASATFDALQTAVLEVVQTQGDAAGEAGVSVESIVASLTAKAVMASLDDIRTALANLVVQGYCYTTIDDGHFLAPFFSFRRSLHI